MSGWVMILPVPGVALSMARNSLVLVGGMGKVPWLLGDGKTVAGKVSLGGYLRVGL